MKKKISSIPVEAVTKWPHYHFFGYYDKSQWDSSERYVLGLEIPFMDRPPSSKDIAIVGMVNLQKDNKWVPLAETHSWHWQQGCMLQWLPSAPDHLIIYNDRIDNRFVSIIRNIRNGESKILPRPIYTVSHSGKEALSLNFSRLHSTRPGYGYAGIVDLGVKELSPSNDGIYWMNLLTGESRLIISIEQIAQTNPNSTMDNKEHWFNHLQFNTDDTRFAFLHRWRKNKKENYTRLYTANTDGSDIYCVADYGMTSHYDWKDTKKILAWARHKQGEHYYLFTDGSSDAEVIGEKNLTCDGHCSYSPDRKWILTDTYPDGEYMRTLILFRLSDQLRINIGRFYAPPELETKIHEAEIHCDLHPRWNRKGDKVCIDSAHTGERQMYVLDVSEIVSEQVVTGE